MPVVLHPLANKYVLIAAGVLLGLLAIALMVFAGTPAAHTDIVNGANNQFQPSDGSHILAGVLWH